MPSPTKASKSNPFPYGWRYVRQRKPGGGYELVEVALTLEDVLHPKEDDVIPEREYHGTDRVYLTEVFRTRPAEPPFSRVTSNLIINWGVKGVGNTSPDLALFVGLKEKPEEDIGTFHLAKSGGRCLFALEMVSPHTRKNDVKDKVKLYHKVGIPVYVIVDQKKELGPRTIRVLRWQEEGYKEEGPDDEGRVLLPGLDLYLKMRDNRPVCFDAKSGRELGNYGKVLEQMEQLERRDQEREQEMESTFLRAHDAEAKAREEAEARKKAEARSRKEAKARKEAEKELRELRERLKQLEG